MLWCQPLYDVVMDQHERIILRRLKLPNIEKALKQFQIRYQEYCESKWGRYVSEKNKDIITKLNATIIILKIARMFIGKETTDFMMDILNASFSDTTYLSQLMKKITKISKILVKTDREQEVTQLFDVRLPAAWDHLLRFCSKGDNYSQSEIGSLVLITCKASVSHLILSKHDYNETKMIFSGFLRKWSPAKMSCDKIPHPNSLIEVWVGTRCIQIQEPDSDQMTLMNLPYNLLCPLFGICQKK